MGTLKLNKNTTMVDERKKEQMENSKVSGFAKEVEDQTITDMNIENTELCVYAKQDDGFVEELKNLRTANETVYKRNDRTCRKVVTAKPTHYRDGNDEYKVIINRLIDNGTEIVNEGNSSKVKFNKSANSGKIFDLQKGKNTVSLSAVGTAKACSHSCGCKCELCLGKDGTVSATLDDGTEIEYVTLNDRIKENIIVKERQDKYEYNFTLSIGNLTVEKGEHNDLLLKDAETGETEFIIPAPYMYDANKKCSDKVSCEIDVNGDELLIKVVADAKFINAEDRAYPVIIDPQIIYTRYNSELNFYSKIQRFNEDQSIDIETYQLDAYELANGQRSEGYIEYTVPAEIDDGMIISAQIIMTTIEGSVGTVYVGGMPVTVNKEEQEVVIDVTEEKRGVKNTIKIVPHSNQACVSFDDPKLIIDYVEVENPYKETEYNQDSKPAVKEFNFVDKTNGYLYLKEGAVVTSFNSFNASDYNLPLDIKHIHKLGLGGTRYGLNWRLNLDRKLTVHSANSPITYVYTDELGDKYVLAERYYYLSAGQKQFVSKNEVTIDQNGDLWFGGYPAYKIHTCNGYTLVTDITEFQNSEIIEQRQEQQIQLEEIVEQYEAILSTYVKVNKKTGAIEGKLDNLDRKTVNNFISSIEEPNDKEESDDNNKSTDYILITKSEADNFKSVISNKEKADEIIEEAEKNLSKVKAAFVKYFKKKRELDLLLLQIPVSYLKDRNGIISGFNKDGDLILISDSYGNAVSISYNIAGYISAIYDKNGMVMSFEFSGIMLTKITDCNGRTTKFTYASDKLDKVEFVDGSTLTFKYSSNLMRAIDSGNALQTKISYDKYNRLSEIKNWSPRLTIGEEVVIEKEVFTEIIDDWNITYGYNKTTITDNEKNGGTYGFDDSGRIVYEETWDNIGNCYKTTYSYINRNSPNINEIRYIFTNDRNTTVIKAKRQKNSEKAVETMSVINGLHLLVKETEDWRNVSDTLKIKTETEYKYDFNENLISEVSKRYIQENDVESCTTSHKNYSYNPQGSLVLTESYIEGEKATSGVNYEKREYSENGALIKTVRWNSLDSSSKFYGESDCAENGQVKSVRNEIGEVSSEYEYESGTNIVNSVKLSNGSKFAYGRNPNNYQITSVTQSTEDGEAGTTDIVYNCGLPVKVKSGSTVIDYTYNAKRSVKEIAVNGVVQYTSEQQGYKVNKDGSVNLLKKTETYSLTDNNYVTAVYTESRKADEGSTTLKLVQTLEVNGAELYRKNYSAKGLLGSISYTDSLPKSIKYTYDSYGLLTKAETVHNEDVIMTERYTYDSGNLLTQKIYTGEVSQTYTYAYKQNAARELDYIAFQYSVYGYAFKFKPLTDVNGRNAGREICNGENKLAAEYVTYRKVGDHATNMPATVWFGNGENITDSIKYKYDSCGNISQITQNGHIIAKYTYDSLNRLIREDNKAAGTTFVYAYDQNGNITERCEYSYTNKSGEELSEQACTHYSYDYKGDKLVSYNNKKFEYNNIGNPTVYRGKNVSWGYGRRLTQLGTTIFQYDGLGRRTKKDSISFIYDNDGRLLKQSNGLEFFYDASGVAGVKYGSKNYFYRKDAQGNIIAILDSNGTAVVNYVYDAWGNNTVVDSNGNVVTSGIGVLNPFRYRGYYYDTETELYYLQTRYYDPEIGRFISQDSLEYADPESINGLNLYAYCGNNPVMNVDPTGTFWSEVGRFLGGLVLGLLGGSLAVATIIPAAFGANGVSQLSTVACEFGLTIGMYGAALMGSVFDSTIYSDMDLIGWNPYNKDANAVVSSQKMSFYQGVPVIRANMGKGRSGSFGIIALDRSVKDADVVRHEFGHIPQLMALGVVKYGLCIGIPSFKEWYLRTPWTYFEAPWDAGADYFGGVQGRPMTTSTKDRSFIYLVLSLFLGPVVHSFYKKL